MSDYIASYHRTPYYIIPHNKDHRHHKCRGATDCTSANHILNNMLLKLTWSTWSTSAFASSSNATTDRWPPVAARMRDVEPFWMIIEWRSLRYFAMSHHMLLLDRVMCHCKMHYFLSAWRILPNSPDHPQPHWRHNHSGDKTELRPHFQSSPRSKVHLAMEALDIKFNRLVSRMFYA